MNSSQTHLPFVIRHSLSLTVATLVVVLTLLYSQSDPSTHLGAFIGNAIADWAGVLVTVIATKYLYERKARTQPSVSSSWPAKLRHLWHNHSLTLFLLASGVAWISVYMRMRPEDKWGQVVGSLVSEWTQTLGMVLLSKRLIERKASDGR